MLVHTALERPTDFLQPLLIILQEIHSSWSAPRMQCPGLPTTRQTKGTLLQLQCQKLQGTCGNAPELLAIIFFPLCTYTTIPSLSVVTITFVQLPWGMCSMYRELWTIYFSPQHSSASNHRLCLTTQPCWISHAQPKPCTKADNQLPRAYFCIAHCKQHTISPPQAGMAHSLLHKGKPGSIGKKHPESAMCEKSLPLLLRRSSTGRLQWGPSEPSLLQAGQAQLSVCLHRSAPAHWAFSWLSSGVTPTALHLSCAQNPSLDALSPPPKKANSKMISKWKKDRLFFLQNLSCWAYFLRIIHKQVWIFTDVLVSWNYRMHCLCQHVSGCWTAD